MKLLSILIALLSFSSPSLETDSSTDLTIVVKKVKSEKGKVSVMLFNSEDGFLKSAFKYQSSEAKPGEMIFVFKNLPQGDYTAYALHDKNSNGKLDMNKLGIPAEPYGMSKDGKSMFGPPNYQKSLFQVGEKHDTITIKIN